MACAVPTTESFVPFEAEKDIGFILNSEQEANLARKIEAGLYAEKVIQICATPASQLNVVRTRLKQALLEEISTARYDGMRVSSLSSDVLSEAEAKTTQLIQTARGYGVSDASEMIALPESTLRDLKQAVLDGRMAKLQMLLANFGLVGKMTKKYIGLDWGVLKQAGKIGLNRAIEKFDYTKGYKFSTYATWWVRGAIDSAFRDESRTQGNPVTVQDASILQRVEDELIQELHRRPTDSELAERSYVDIGKIVRYRSFEDRDIHYDAPLRDGRTLHSLIADGSVAVYEETHNELLSDTLDRLIDDCLTKMQAEIVRLYIFEDTTFDDITVVCGFSRESVRAQYYRAIDTLRYVAGQPMQNPPKQSGKQQRLVGLRRDFGPAARALKDFL